MITLKTEMIALALTYHIYIYHKIHITTLKSIFSTYMSYIILAPECVFKLF